MTTPPAARARTSAQRLVLLLAAVLTAILTLVAGPAEGALAVTKTASDTITADANNASGHTGPAAETRVGASTLAVASLVGAADGIAAGQRRGHGSLRLGFVSATSVAAESGAANVVNGVRLRAQLTGEEIAGGHAFEKHILDLGEFPGIRTRAQFAAHIEDAVMNGEMRTLGGGRTAYWRDGTVVIRNPRAADGGTAFQPTDGYDYFLNQLH